MTCWCKLDIVTVAIEKFYTQFIFQLPDSCTDGGLGHEKIVSGIAEMASPMDFKKGLENINIHFWYYSSVSPFNYSGIIGPYTLFFN